MSVEAGQRGRMDVRDTLSSLLNLAKELHPSELVLLMQQVPDQVLEDWDTGFIKLEKPVVLENMLLVGYGKLVFVNHPVKLVGFETSRLTINPLLEGVDTSTLVSPPTMYATLLSIFNTTLVASDPRVSRQILRGLYTTTSWGAQRAVENALAELLELFDISRAVVYPSSSYTPHFKLVSRHPRLGRLVIRMWSGPNIMVEISLPGQGERRYFPVVSRDLLVYLSNNPAVSNALQEGERVLSTQKTLWMQRISRSLAALLSFLRTYE